MLKLIKEANMYRLVTKGRFISKSLYKIVPFEIKFLFLGIYFSLSYIYFIDMKIDIL